MANKNLFNINSNKLLINEEKDTKYIIYIYVLAIFFSLFILFILNLSFLLSLSLSIISLLSAAIYDIIIFVKYKKTYNNLIDFYQKYQKNNKDYLILNNIYNYYFKKSKNNIENDNYVNIYMKCEKILKLLDKKLNNEIISNKEKEDFVIYYLKLNEIYLKGNFNE